MNPARALALCLALAPVPVAADRPVPASVGQILGGPWGPCTGVLVAPDQVLAQAACLRGPFGGPAEATRLAFRPGAGTGATRGARLILHPAFDAAVRFRDGQDVDAALLVLAAPVDPVAARPVGLRAAATGRDYMMVHVLPRGGARHGAHVETLPLRRTLTDLRALAAGRDPPRVLRGGAARASHELPGRLGITRP
ncbi:MAG: hypothetical protein KF887_15600 [Paracoccaceae bacterium]|nr:MAG: hypothetical protein KF887_15600 [Paracoccaceae bacterium]